MPMKSVNGFGLFAHTVATIFCRWNDSDGEGGGEEDLLLLGLSSVRRGPVLRPAHDISQYPRQKTERMGNETVTLVSNVYSKIEI